MTEQTEQTEPTTCPEAMGMTVALLLGLKGPQPYCPTPAREVLLLRARGRDFDDDTPEPEPPELDSLPELMTTEEARHALGIGLTTIARRLHEMKLQPAGRGRGRTKLWSAEQVRAVASYRTKGAAAHG